MSRRYLAVAALLVLAAASLIAYKVLHLGYELVPGPAPDRWSVQTEVEIGQAFVDKLLAAHVRGEEIVSEVSMAKWWTTDLQKRLTSECLQLHGGYGFMLEVPISQDYADAAVQSIYAGTNEIMKVLIARRLGLDPTRG